MLAIARAGAAAGCTEALFTLGDKPELRYKVARAELAALGCETTLEYLARVAKLVLDETGLLPHLNPGVMSRADLVALRPVSASMGIMLETTAERLAGRGGPHWASPDKEPARRLETIALAGELRIPFTSGILIGIGETRAERLEALEALRALHERHGHLQEVIVQNFRAKPGTRMASHAEPSLEDHLWTIAAARLLLPEDVAVQAPPNLAYDDFPRLLDAGIDDWGGVSPVTIDHVNPEAPWPERDRLAEATRARGLELAPRLPVYPGYLSGVWIDLAVLPTALRASDALGSPGRTAGIPARRAESRSSFAGMCFRSTPPSSGRKSSSASSGPAAMSASACSRRPTGCDMRCAATRSATSSPGISSTRTSATSAAAFARSRRVVLQRTCEVRRTSSRSTRSSGAPRRRGIGARPRSVFRAAFTRRSPATTTRPWSRRSGPSCRSCTSTRSRRSRSGRAPRRSACHWRTTWRGSVRWAWARCRGPPPRSSTTRCAVFRNGFFRKY